MTKTFQKNFRLPKETVRQLTELSEAWGDTLTRVIIRAIDQTYGRLKKTKKKEDQEKKHLAGIDTPCKDKVE
jgi:predicted transcriptional regulator